MKGFPLALKIVLLCGLVLGAVALAIGLVYPYWRAPDRDRFPVSQRAPDFELTNQDGIKVRLADLAGRIKLLSFIYVRCHLPSVCPATTRHFRQVQELLGADLSNRVTLITITFDPEWDSGGMLKRYGEIYGADLGNWQFLTGSKAEVDKVCEAYGFIHEASPEVEGDPTIRHSAITYLIDGENRIRQQYFANAWDPAAVVGDIRGLLRRR